MARPQKIGLDYFPLDCKQDKKINAIIRKFGAEGFGVFISILQSIYSEGYFIKWNDQVTEDFSLELNVDFDLVNDLVLFCVKREIFNPSIFNSENVLTSNGIQKRFMEATKRRSSNNSVNKYCVIVDENTQAVELLHTETPLSEINEDNSTQRKEKKRKEENSIEHEEEPPQHEEEPPQQKFNPKKYSEQYEWIDNDLWIEWVEHKKKVKASVTERALKANVKKLEGFGKERSSEMIDLALIKNWKDFYEIDNTFNNNGAIGQVVRSSGPIKTAPFSGDF